jgi:hypothetical protein
MLPQIGLWKNTWIAFVAEWFEGYGYRNID